VSQSAVFAELEEPSLLPTASAIDRPRKDTWELAAAVEPVLQAMHIEQELVALRNASGLSQRQRSPAAADDRHSGRLVQRVLGCLLLFRIGFRLDPANSLVGRQVQFR
jgi:hypothetical protein